MLPERVGLYVDQANINGSGGFELDYSALRDFSLRGGAKGVQLNIYSSIDPVKNERDTGWSGRVMGFHTAIRSLGYHLFVKEAKHYDDGEKVVTKANVDVDIAVNVMENAAKLDRIILMSGDGDFAPLIAAARRLGARVEVIAMDTCSAALRNEADALFNGWLIPDLMPSLEKVGNNLQWGLSGSRVRGTIESIDEENRMGTIRYMKHLRGADHTTVFAPLAPENQGMAVFDLCELNNLDLFSMRGAIVEFTLMGEMDLLASAKELLLHRAPTRSGWYRPWLS